MSVVGQEAIISKINSKNIDTFPRSLILSGDYGSGKHLLVDYISIHLGLPIMDISETINQETIDSAYTSSLQYIYVINEDKLTVKNENMLLKFLEEPLKNSYIIILSEDYRKLIPTIQNRCQVWVLDKYSKDLLRSYSDNEYILKYATTPGQIKLYQSLDPANIESFVISIFDNIERASIPNIFKLTSKIAFDNELNRFNLNLFNKIFLYIAREYLVEGKISFAVFNIINKYYNMCREKNVNKKYLFENCILNIRRTYL